MSRKRFFIILLLVANVVLLVGGIYCRKQKQQQADRMLRDATRYSGWTGPTITAFDERTNRWIAEMKEESVEVTLQKLTDAAEYFWVGGGGYQLPFRRTFENAREAFCGADMKDILSNRRFRKAFEDIGRTDRKKAAGLLTKNIRENLTELRILLQEYKDMYSQGEVKGPTIVKGTPDDNFYRLSYYHPDRPPTHFARRYAVFSYLLLAAHFELHEVRPAVEEVIQLAKEEFEFFNSMDMEKAHFFKITVFTLSLFRPSLLLTATLCDTTWNTEKRKALAAKLISKEIVDWQARALEYDHDAVVGLIPIVPHEEMLKLRYYEGITDAEFNEFFGE